VIGIVNRFRLIAALERSLSQDEERAEVAQ
jgi:hypothetical protein